jgi:hypothetical protein
MRRREPAGFDFTIVVLTPYLTQAGESVVKMGHTGVIEG